MQSTCSTTYPSKSAAYLWSVEEASSVPGGLTETITFLRRSLKIERNRCRKENKTVENGGVKQWRQGDTLNGMEWNGMEWDGMGWNGMEWNGMNEMNE